MSRTSAAERAHAEIRDAIRRGELPPGTMLSENELAASMSLSRTPVRAALGRLQDEGWVTIYPQRGALVRALTAAEVRESAEVRHAFETAGVRLARPAEREALPQKLAGNLTAQEKALKDADVPAFAAVAAEFHREFVLLAHNATMQTAYDRLHDRQVLSIVRSGGHLVADPDHAIAEHRTLLTHAAAGDWAAFAHHLEQHQLHSHDLETPAR